MHVIERHDFRIVYKNGHIANASAYYWESLVGLDTSIELVYDMTACVTVYKCNKNKRKPRITK